MIFGTMPDGRTVEAATISAGDLSATLLTHGARLQDLRLAGVGFGLVLGAPALAPYLGPMGYSGAMVGRFANRIAHGRFTLDGHEIRTDRNGAGGHTLHGGAHAAEQQVWHLTEHGPDRASFALTLPDGQNGFPGRLEVRVTYTIVPPARLGIVTEATTDAPTPCSFAQHAYFRLTPGDARGHRLRVDAAHYLPVDDTLIPTGRIAPVAGTPFDFRKPRVIGNTGLDHNFCLSRNRTDLREVAALSAPATGLTMTVETTETGIQVYDGGGTAGMTGHGGEALPAHAGVALETQVWPDAPNRPDFPDPILRPGESYRHEVVYAFR